MTPELYKYWYEGGKLEYRQKPSGLWDKYRQGPSELWHTLEPRTETSSLMICNAFEFRKKKNPHKHAEVIKAWADGASIEVRIPEGSWALATLPSWNEHYEYRVKTE